MGRSRHLCYALNELRRRREAGEEERRPGIRPVVPRFNHWERVLGGNNFGCYTRGRSRSFPALQPLDIRRQSHSQPHCLAAGFGYVAQNTQFPP